MADKIIQQDKQQLLHQIDDQIKNIEKKLQHEEEDITVATEEQKQEMEYDLNAARLQKEIKQHINEKMEFYYNPPRFLKPAFFLDEYTPYLKVTLITDITDVNNPKKRFELFDTLSQDDPVHNHLCNFIYESTPNSNETATIVLQDIEQNTVDNVLFMLSALQNGKLDNGKITGIIYIEVQFGWCPPRDGKKTKSDYSNDFGFIFQNNDIKEFVRFTRTIYVVPGDAEGDMGITVEYTPEGTAKMTIKGTVDQTFPDPFKAISPMSIFGPMPAVNLTLFNLDRLLYYFVYEIVKATGGLKNFNDNAKSILTKYYYTMVYSYNTRLDSNKDLLHNILINALNFYCCQCSEQYDSIAIYRHAITQIFNNLETIGNADIQIEDSSTRIDSFKKMLDEQYQQATINYILNNKRVQDNYYAKYFENLFISDYNIVSGTESNPGHQMYLYLILKEFKKLNIPIQAIPRTGSKSLLRHALNYYQTIGQVAQEIKLHPYYLYAYIMQGLHENLEKFNEAKCKLLFLDYGAMQDLITKSQQQEQNQIITEMDINIPSIASLWDTTNVCYKTNNKQKNQKKKEYDGNVKYDGNVIPFTDNSVRERTAKWSNIETYFASAFEFNVNFTTSWENYLSNICNKIFIKYDVRNESHARTLISEEELKAAKQEQKKSKNKTLKVPVRLKQRMFITSSNDALENVYTQYRIVSGLKTIIEKELNNKKDTYKNTYLSNKKENIKRYLDALKLKANYIKNNPQFKYLVCIRDVVSSDEIFDPEITATSILQTFSYRTNNAFDGQWDPGFKSCWTVNFPDVIEFSPQYNPFQAVMEITKNAHYIGDTVDVSQILGQEDIKRLADDIQKLSDQIITKTKKSKQDIQNFKDKLETYKLEFNNYKRLNDITKKYGHKMQFGHYGDNIVLNSGETHVQSVLRHQQTMRRRMLLSTNVFNANLKVLGDPNFDLFSRGKYIFLKFINNDGMLGFFTGIYNITGITHNIDADSFTTLLNLSYYPLLDTIGINDSLERIINESDILTAKIDIHS